MLFALYQKISNIVAESPEELGNVIVRLGGFHLLMPLISAVGTVEHCACTFICVTHGHRPCILPCTQTTLCDPEALATILLKTSKFT